MWRTGLKKGKGHWKDGGFARSVKIYLWWIHKGICNVSSLHHLCFMWVQIITMCSSLVSPRHFCIVLWKDMKKRMSHLSCPIVIARSGTAKDYWPRFFRKMGPKAPAEQSRGVWEEELYIKGMVDY
ncbi:unnamed protein product [Miscanthus lutarioriparius]|uniref:Uncharacterized protein n=1 Tax=Miscanthus lutarioriparius TaxID=422564 RepID=A0A811N4L3_9POAL|nr:unnamed protein product [Miscanthus lutarioriparius]